eukprot:513772_1
MALALSTNFKQLDLIELQLVSQRVKIKNSESYMHWKTFCTEALYNSKEIISRHDNDRTKEQRGELVTILEKLHWWILKFGENGINVLVTLLGLGSVAFAAALVATVTTLVGSIFTPWGLIAVATGGGILALTISYAKYLYSHKQLVLLALAILDDQKIVYITFQNQNKRMYIDTLFVECVKKLIEELYNKKIMLNDYSLPIHPICVCGNELTGESLENVYKLSLNQVNCNVCGKAITHDSELYHCNKNTETHPNCYDMCIPCARIYSKRLKRYHAFIIFDSNGFKRQDSKSEFKDGDILYDLFKNTLGYHSVKMLKDNQITKNNIFSYLRKLSIKDDNDVIVICYSGHGNNPGNGAFVFETTDGDITNDEFLFHLLGNKAQTLYNFKTKDVLLMLNACRSGSFEIRDDSKNDDENLKEFVHSLNEFRNNMKKVTKSMFVVSAATKKQDAMPGTISPFVKFFVESMSLNKNKDASPKDIYQYISTKSSNDECILNFGFLIKDFATPNVASQTGKFAETFSLVPIHKMETIVDNYNKRNGMTVADIKESKAKPKTKSKANDTTHIEFESKCICGNVLQPKNSNDCIKKQIYVFDETLIGDNITLIDQQTIKQNGYNYKHYNAYSKCTLNKDFNHVSFKLLKLGENVKVSIGIGIIPIELLTNEGGSQKYVGSNEFKDSVGYWGYDGEIHKNGCKVVNGNVFDKNDIISFKIDFKQNNIQFYKNNVKQGQCIEIENDTKYKACVTLLRDGQSVQFV